MVKLDLKPVQWAGLAIAGACLAGATWFLFFVPVPELSRHGAGFWNGVWADRLRFLVYGTPLVVGLAVCFWAQRRFRDQFNEDAWSENELAPVRTLLALKQWRWIGLAWLVFCVLSLVFFRHSAGPGVFFYVVTMPTQTAQNLRQLVSPPRKPGSGMPSWRDLKPIRSEHWGER